jgi:probable HAF family extracellular repeat protein
MFQGLGFLPDQYDSRAFGISRNGEFVVGRSGLEAFRWHSTTGMVGLGIPPNSHQSEASAVSDDASVVVGYYIYPQQAPFRLQAFRWTEETGIVGLGYLPGSAGQHSIAGAVSADGSVVVGASDYEPGESRTQAFRWTQVTGMVGLGFLPGGNHSSAHDVLADGSVIFGASALSSGVQVFRWTQETGMVELGAPAVSAVSADGTVIVGTARHGYPERDEAFRWTETSTTWLGDLPGGQQASAAGDVSANGSVVIGWSATSIGNEAFIWDAAHGMRSIKQVLLDLGVWSVDGWTLGSAEALSADGTVVVGYGRNPGGYEEAWLAKVLCAGDLTGDGDTDQSDLGMLLGDWGCTGGNCEGDLDGDGDTDQADLGILLADWGCGT